MDNLGVVAQSNGRSDGKTASAHSFWPKSILENGSSATQLIGTRGGPSLSVAASVAPQHVTIGIKCSNHQTIIVQVAAWPIFSGSLQIALHHGLCSKRTCCRVIECAIPQQQVVVLAHSVQLAAAKALHNHTLVTLRRWCKCTNQSAVRTSCSAG